jgi:hypothetical protein
MLPLDEVCAALLHFNLNPRNDQLCFMTSKATLLKGTHVLYFTVRIQSFETLQYAFRVVCWLLGIAVLE